jgi:MYXO-CTERM domain-containing protein
VITSPPTNVTSTSAELNGSVDPNGAATTAWFRYDTTDPGACDDTFGTRAPGSGGTMAGSGTDPVPFTEAVTGLVPETTYYYCAIAENSFGKQFGEVVAFKPGTTAPTVTTEMATDVLADSATLQGTVNPNGTDSVGWFRLGDVDPGTGACDDTYGKRVPEMGGSMVGAGAMPVPFSQAATGLEPNKTYYYCAAASNLGGASFGAVMSFTTAAAPPIVTTLAPEVTGAGEATLNGSANPNGSKTSVWFRFDVTDPGACNDTFGARVPDPDGKDIGEDRLDVTFSETLSGLAAGTYYVCAIGSNSAGLGFGEVMTFEMKEGGTTPPPPPAEDCGCRMVSNRNGSGVVAVIAVALLALRRRRRAA